METTKKKLLVIDDDPRLRELLLRYLTEQGFDVDAYADASQLEKRLQRNRPHLLILDLMLPGEDGLSVCRKLRALGDTLPVIMLTARGDEVDRIVGLEMGADDYLAKPFSPGELVARVRALLRRSARPAAVGSTIAYGPLVVDSAQHTVTDAGQPVSLTAKEFLFLQYLLRNRGRVLSRDALLTDVWGYKYTGGTRTVDVHVRRLREKIPFLEEALVTVKQFGYRLLETAPGPA